MTNNVNSFFNQNIYKYAFLIFTVTFTHIHICSYILKRHFKSNQVLLLIILHSVYCHSSGCKFRGHLSNNNIFSKKFYWQKQETNCTVTAKTIANKLTGDGFVLKLASLKKKISRQYWLWVKKCRFLCSFENLWIILTIQNVNLKYNNTCVSVI